MLLLDHEPLPWTRWGEEFAAAMPAEIRRLQEHAATTDGTPRQDAIRSRVASIMPLYRLSPYRPHSHPETDGTQRRRPLATSRPTRPPASTAYRTAVPDGAGGRPGRERAHGEPAANRDRSRTLTMRRPRRSVSLPDVGWISARDGSGAPGDLEDQAARYHPGRHELTINADFRAITDLIAHWQDR